MTAQEFTQLCDSKLKCLVLGKNGKPFWVKKGLLPVGKAGLSYLAIQSVIQLISLHREYFGWQADRKEHYLQSAGLTSIVFICSACLQKALYSDCPPRWTTRGRLGLPHQGLFKRVPVAQLDRALACGAKGRRFESPRAHHEITTPPFWWFFIFARL